MCLTPEALTELNAVITAKKLRLKVMSDDTAEVFINGVNIYKDPVANHDPQ
jgi:hypothetical protein